jgi:NADPH2:quinone reductase
VLNPSEPGYPDALQALAHQLNTTLFLDAVAGEETQHFMDAAPAGSTILLYAHLSGEPRLSNSSALVGKRLEGFYLPNWLARRNPLQILFDVRRVRNLAATTLQTTVQKRSFSHRHKKPSRPTGKTWAPGKSC